MVLVVACVTCRSTPSIPFPPLPRPCLFCIRINTHYSKSALLRRIATLYADMLDERGGRKHRGASDASTEKVLILDEIFPKPTCFLANKILVCLFFFFAHFYFPASGQAVVTGVIPSPPRFLPSIFIAHRVQQSHCSSIFHRVLLTHALALSASQFVHKKKSQRFYTSMHSAGLELTKLTYTRLEDNLIRHRGDRLAYSRPWGPWVCPFIGLHFQFFYSKSVFWVRYRDPQATTLVACYVEVSLFV